MVGFVGANGAGKSTTMRIAMGLLAADSGTVPGTDAPLTFATRQRFGYMPEERGLYPKMRVVEQVAYFGRLRGMPRGRGRRGRRARSSSEMDVRRRRRATTCRRCRWATSSASSSPRRSSTTRSC